ncbi:MAG: hypothetical protein ACXAC8_00805 [Candidatus Hodarchaeales archaeon]|jgi:chromosome segregation ATPase
MTIPKSAEEIRKMELGLEELVTKFTGRVQLIREDLKSLVIDIESLKNYIGGRRRISNDYTREISDLTNDLQSFHDEIGQIEREITTSQNNVDAINTQSSQQKSDLSADKNELNILDSEKTSLSMTLRSLEVELASLEKTNNELKPKFEQQMNAHEEEFNKLNVEKSNITNRFQAVRTLCSRDYIQSPEVNLIKFLAKKPSPDSTITEIRSALGLDQNTLNTVLSGLSARNVLEFNESQSQIKLLVTIDLFDEEV